MRIERVVVNASPLICLFESRLANLLQTLFSEIIVPDSVYQEIMAKGIIDSVSRELLSSKWIKQVKDITIQPSVASWDLGEGEGAVLSFTLNNPEYWAVIDDREARRCADSLGCRYTGTIGIILLAKKRGIISSVSENLEQLQKAGLWLSKSFCKEICRKFDIER